MTSLHGDRLDTWIAAVEADDLPHLHSFTSGLRRDHTAVLNGLTTSHNSGLVEGTVNKIKFFKRQMVGRAKARPTPQTCSPRRVIRSRKVRQNLNYLNAEPASWGIT